MTDVQGVVTRAEACFFLKRQTASWEWLEHDDGEGGSSHHRTQQDAEKHITTLVDRGAQQPLRVAQYATACTIATCTKCDTTFDTEGEGCTVHWPDGVDATVRAMTDMQWTVIDGELVCDQCRCAIEGHRWDPTVHGDRQWCLSCSDSRPVETVAGL